LPEQSRISPEPASQDKPISAVFVLEVSPITGPMLAGWVEKGHHIAAIVVPASRRRGRFSVASLRRRLRRRLVLSRHIGRTRVPLIEFGRPHDWDALSSRLADLGADVLICFGFHTLIPDAVLKRFAKGGVNLHPALLPHYRGPHPIHRLVLDRQFEAYGGVTLHKMTAGFDAGDILAQVPFSDRDWRSAATVSQALAGGMKMLVTEAAPDLCTGALTGTPQPMGNFTWAQIDQTPLVVRREWSASHVARLWHVLGRSLAIHVLVNGSLVRLSYPIRRLGPATGEAPVRRWGRVEFDCADGRVAHLVYNRFFKRLMRWQRMLSRLQFEHPPLKMHRFGDRTEDQSLSCHD
jgi:methionyl-tRNA formyltransferase